MSRFLNLPTELRLLIYIYALTGPDNVIGIYFSFQTNHVKPNLSLNLVRTCKRIYHEAHDILYTKNTILISVGRQETRLPPHVLGNLRHIFILLKSTVYWQDECLVDNIDFSKIQAMTKLQNLRICVIDIALTTTRPIECWTSVLSAFIENVPAGCEILFGTDTRAERAFAYSSMRTLVKKCCEQCETEPLPWEFEGHQYEEAMKRVKAVKGAKSGHFDLSADQAEFQSAAQSNDGPRVW